MVGWVGINGKFKASRRPKTVTDGNVAGKSWDFYYQMRNTSVHWLGKNYMQSFGGDFEFTHADLNFNNLDKLFTNINKNRDTFRKFEVEFSTPGNYIREKNKESLRFPLKD